MKKSPYCWDPQIVDDDDELKQKPKEKGKVVFRVKKRKNFRR